MQPSAATNTQDVLIRDRGAGLAEMPLNSESFWSKSSQNVDADQVFFHQYFNRAEKRRSKKPKKTQKEVTDMAGATAVDDGSSEDEQEIWDALVKSNTELQGEPDENDDNLDLDDLSSDGDDAGDFDMSDVEQSQRDDTNEGSKNLKNSNINNDDSSYFDDDDEQLLLDSDDTKASIKRQADYLRSKRRKDLKSLPTFAAADDYADILVKEEGDEDY